MSFGTVKTWWYCPMNDRRHKSATGVQASGHKLEMSRRMCWNVHPDYYYTYDDYLGVVLWNGLTLIPWLLWRCAGECKVSWGGCWRCAMNKFNAAFQRLFCHLQLNRGQNTDPTIVILSKFVLCKFYVSMRRVICWAGPQRRRAFSWGGASPFDPNRERISKVGLRDMLQWALTTFPKLLCQRVKTEGFKIELDQSGSVFYCNASLEPTDPP